MIERLSIILVPFVEQMLRGLRSKVPTKRTKNKRTKGRPRSVPAQRVPRKGLARVSESVSLRAHDRTSRHAGSEPKFATDLDCQVHASKIISLARPFVPINVHRIHNALIVSSSCQNIRTQKCSYWTNDHRLLTSFVICVSRVANITIGCLFPEYEPKYTIRKRKQTIHET